MSIDVVFDVVSEEYALWSWLRDPKLGEHLVLVDFLFPSEVASPTMTMIRGP